MPGSGTGVNAFCVKVRDRSSRNVPKVASLTKSFSRSPKAIATTELKLVGGNRETSSSGNYWSRLKELIMERSGEVYSPNPDAVDICKITGSELPTGPNPVHSCLPAMARRLVRRQNYRFS